MTVAVKDLSFTYGTHSVLAGIDMSMEKGRVSAIVGPNAVGKTTLLRCIGKIYKPRSGAVYIDGKAVGQMSGLEFARMLAYVPQSSPRSFSVTVYEAVLLGRKPHLAWSVSRHDREIVAGLLRRLNIEHLAWRSVEELSGGERQKVALARALAQEPAILLLDEPTTSLDMKHQLELMEMVRALASEQGVTVVMVLHDLNLAFRYADYAFLLSTDGIYAQGDPRQVFTPDNIAAVYEVEAQVVDTLNGPHLLPVRQLPA